MAETPSEVLAKLQLLVGRFEFQPSKTVDPGLRGPEGPLSVSGGKVVATSQTLELPWWTAAQDEILLYSWRNFAFHYPCLKDCLILSTIDENFEWRETLDILGSKEYPLKIPDYLEETYWRRFGYSLMHARLEELLHHKAMDVYCQIELSQRSALLKQEALPEINCRVETQAFRESNNRPVLQRTGGGICWYCEFKSRKYSVYFRLPDEGQRSPVCGGCGADTTGPNVILRVNHYPPQDSRDYYRLTACLGEWIRLKARLELRSKTDSLTTQESRKLTTLEARLQKMGLSWWEPLSREEYENWRSTANYEAKDLGLVDSLKLSAQKTIKSMGQCLI